MFDAADDIGSWLGCATSGDRADGAIARVAGSGRCGDGSNCYLSEHMSCLQVLALQNGDAVAGQRAVGFSDDEFRVVLSFGECGHGLLLLRGFALLGVAGGVDCCRVDFGFGRGGTHGVA